MIIIRNEQREALRHIVNQSFIEELSAFLAQEFSEDSKILGHEQVRIVVKLGIQQSQAYGFNTTEDIKKYVKLMFLLGSYFDEDPIFPWAKKILQNPSFTSPSFRMHNLYVTANRFLKKTAGDKGQHYRAALIRAYHMRYEEYICNSGLDLISHIQTILSSLYPQQYRHISHSSFQALIQLAKNIACEFNVSSRGGTSIIAVLMFMLGCHFYRDPLHPWVKSILQSDLKLENKPQEIQKVAKAQLEQYRIAQG